MNADKQTISACIRRAAAAGAVVAAHIVALHATAQAQVQGAAHFVAPAVTPVAATAAAPPAAVAAVAGPAARPASRDMVKPAALPSPTAPLPPPAACSAPAEFSHLDHPLLHTMRRLANGEPLTIVAIGSSSTAGAGASAPAASYPSRLAIELKTRFPGRDVAVLNRGVNGEETDNMIARFDADVIAAHPQLVLWQVGTNSVLRDRALARHAVELRQGIAALKAAGADVVLIDPQYVPAVLAKPETAGMVDQIALAAKETDVDLFRRFSIMRNWYEVQHLGFDVFVSPDHLHMNDWSYACWAKLLGAALAEAATRPIAAASAHLGH